MDIKPVKPILLLLYSDTQLLSQALEKLTQAFGPIDYQSASHPFDHTDFYEGEMGQGLRRLLISFTSPQPPDFIAQAKIKCNGLEQELSQEGHRQVNLDMGYLDFFKVVLASMKERGNKIYLSEGVWIDWVLRFFDGDWVPFEWTFPDFLIPRFYEDLSKIRLTYRHQLKGMD